MREVLDAKLEEVLENEISLRTHHNSGTQLDNEILNCRLDNTSKRKRFDETDNIFVELSRESIDAAVLPLIERLKALREDIVGPSEIENCCPHREQSSLTASEPQSILFQELEEWKKLEPLIRDRIIHGSYPQQTSKIGCQSPISPSSPSSSSLSSPEFSPKLDPTPTDPALDGVSLMGTSQSSQFHPDPEKISRRISNPSISSMLLETHIPVDIFTGRYDPRQKVPASIQSLSRSRDGTTIQSITTLSQDGLIEVQHCVSEKTVSDKIETSMIPFLGCTHVNKKYKFRVQFIGSHVTKIKDHGSIVRGSPTPPIYLFRNEKGEDN